MQGPPPLPLQTEATAECAYFITLPLHCVSHGKAFAMQVAIPLLYGRGCGSCSKHVTQNNCRNRAKLLLLAGQRAS